MGCWVELENIRCIRAHKKAQTHVNFRGAVCVRLLDRGLLHCPDNSCCRGIEVQFIPQKLEPPTWLGLLSRVKYVRRHDNE